MLDARLDGLRARHAALDAAIADEEARPLPNFLTIRALKRRKLILKDSILQRAHNLGVATHPEMSSLRGDIDPCRS